MNNPYLPVKAEILDIEKQTAVDYTFRLSADLDVQSGQFVEVSIPRVGEAPISVSDFGDGFIEMTIRRVGKLTGVIHELKPGDHLFIRGPYGHGFPLERFRSRRLVVAAGGTGLAPVKSVLNHYYRNPEEINGLDLLAGFKSPADVLFAAELEKWAQKFSVTVTVDRGDEHWTGQVGLITGCVQQLAPVDPAGTQVIVVGPPLMMKFTVQEMLNLEVPPENIWVSFERKMCCGLGKCGHCKIDDTYVCLDGPVFNYTRAGRLLD